MQFQFCDDNHATQGFNKKVVIRVLYFTRDRLKSYKLIYILYITLYKQTLYSITCSMSYNLETCLA